MSQNSIMATTIMKANEVLRLYNLFLENDIQIWIDGGWGIDALLARQTREHNDLDIAVDRKDSKKLKEILISIGYSRKVDRPDSSEYQYVLADSKNNQIDIHVFEFDKNGKQIYGILYPKASLSGEGYIKGQKVKCIPVEYVIKWHELYEPQEKDIMDIKALCQKFGVKPPKNYRGLLSG